MPDMEGASTRRVVYDKPFFDQMTEGSLSSARVVLPILFRYSKPTSIVDVGCGRGTWLKAAAECGVQDLLGIDGDYVERDSLLIDKKDFQPWNLAERIEIPRRFDLAISVEVAEHLSFYRAETFVADLVRLSDAVLFSAALPYQGGTDHINEQWLEFWAILFRRHDYVPCDLFRRQIWGDKRVEFWYSQNLLLFCKQDLAHKLFPPETIATDRPLSFAHPLTFLVNVTRYRPLSGMALDLEFHDYHSLLAAYLSGETSLPLLKILSGTGETDGARVDLFPHARTQIVDAREQLTARNRTIQLQSAELAGRDAEIARLSAELAGRDAEIARLSTELAGRDAEIRNLSAEFASQKTENEHLKNQSVRLSKELAERDGSLDAMGASFSWRVTAPLRRLAFCAQVPARLVRRLRTGGLRSALIGVSARTQAMKYARLVARSGLFDRGYYLAHNPDVARTGTDPLKQYLIRGAKEGRNPNPLFDGSYYLSQNPDVAKAGVNPLVHYLSHGAGEGRNPNPLFDGSYYLSQNPDVAKAGVNPLAHYLAQGANEGRSPHPLFDGSYYLSQNPDVAKAGVNPLAHYLAQGANEGRNPHPLFDGSYYLSQNPDVAKAGVNLLAHYLAQGANEGRNPHPLFDGHYYLSQNPDVAKAGVNPLAHYVLYGAYDGRDPHPNFDSSYYLEQNPDVAEARLNPLAHYVGPGIAEGRDPNQYFDTSAYLEDNLEVPLGGLNPLVHHLAHLARFDLRAALRSEFEESGRVLLDSEYDSYPLVSVVIPCFNHGHFVEDAVLSSLLACSYPLEIIVVDDGSTDSQSVALVDELADRYKLTLVRQANTGRASARNAGIQHARGKFIQLLDADDLLAPGKIDVQLDEFRSDPEIDICISEYEFCDAGGLGRWMNNPSTIDGFSPSTEDFLLRWERGLSIPIHCPLFRRELLEETNFQLVTHSAHEDWIFWVELSLRSPKFKFNSAVLVAYRLHGQNTTSNHEVMGLDFLRACMYIAEAGLNRGNSSFLRDSIQHFCKAYLGSIKHEAIEWSRAHPAE